MRPTQSLIRWGSILARTGRAIDFAPDVRRRRTWVSPGSVAATLLWMFASVGLDWYADHFGDYQKTYGAIGGVIVVLLWLYASGLAILIGAELNAAIEGVAAESPAPGSMVSLEPPGPRPSAA